MYSFPYYTEPDHQKVIAFMKQHAFAMITGIGNNGPVATQVPVTIIEQGGQLFLEGHIMRKTDHQLAFEKNNQVLVMFTGPHCYVNANWYTNPSIGSTWNYMTVQAKGIIHFLDEANTRLAVKALSDTYTGTGSAASFDQLSTEYIDHMVKAIVGFRIEVQSIENTFKLSQNRDIASQKNIIKELRKRGDAQSIAVAHEMELRLTE
ncbi:MAG: FMN-binding negative transcriptional regulator [Bacteroidetes bacterium]|nr:FMN-binding negative transcriptional regulator [Bacteroidota bacterium]